MGEFIASIDTDVPVRRSVEHIRALVERFEAREFRLIYGTGAQVVAVRFAIVDPHLGGAPLAVELRAPTERLRARLGNKANAEAQAERVAWRHLHDFIRASLIAVQDGLLTLGEAFFANLIVRDERGGEQRLADMLIEQKILQPSNGMLRLGPGTRDR